MTRTAAQLATDMAACNPTTRYGYTTDGNTVGIYFPADSTWYPYLGRTLMGTWAPVPRVLLNGQRPARTWIAVP